MTKIFSIFFRDLIENLLNYIIENGLTSISEVAFKAESHITNMGLNGLEGLFNIFISFGVSLIVLKFLKKGFDIYILWTDGDADLDPLTLATNFFKAIVVAISFSTMYGWLIDVVDDIVVRVINSTALSATHTELAFTTFDFALMGIVQIIIMIIFFIFLMLLYIQFIKQGLSIMVLRIGLPLACVGLMDANKGVFNSYIQKLFQLVLAVMVQVILLRIGITLIIHAHPIWAIASISYALQVPSFLQEFLIFSGGTGGGGMLSKANSVTHFAASIKRIVK